MYQFEDLIYKPIANGDMELTREDIVTYEFYAS